MPVRQSTPVVGSRWAVLVGVSTYADERLSLQYAARDATKLAELIRTPHGGGSPALVACPSGARADAVSFADTLTGLGLVAAEDVVVLLDAEATRQRILTEFASLAAHAATDLAVFHFAGVGSWTLDGRPTLLSVDARAVAGSGRAPDLPVPDLPVVDLAAVSADAPNLVAVIDVGSFAGSAPLPTDGAVLAPGSRAAMPAGDGLALTTPTWPVDAVLGAVTLVPAVPKGTKDRAVERVTPSGAVRGRLTVGIERALERALSSRRPHEPMTYVQLVSRSGLRGRAAVSGVASTEPVLRHRTALATADAALRELELVPVRACLRLASALIDDADSRNEPAPAPTSRRGWHSTRSASTTAPCATCVPRATSRTTARGRSSPPRWTCRSPSGTGGRATTWAGSSTSRAAISTRPSLPSARPRRGQARAAHVVSPRARHQDPGRARVSARRRSALAPLPRPWRALGSRGARP